MTVVVLAGGCNRVFGIEPTAAVQFDAPLDAPFQCPPIGVQPRFSPVLQQAVTRSCLFYTTTRDRTLAAASCEASALDDLPETGLPDGTLAPASLTGAPAASTFGEVRLTPEGDELWVRRLTPAGATISVYRRVTDTDWTFVRDLSITTAADDRISAPSERIAGSRRLLMHAFASFALREFSDDGTTTTLERAYTMSDLGVTYALFPNLTADGLRLVFAGEPETGSTGVATMYADRPGVNDRFGKAVALTAGPVAHDPFLTADCGRLYTWGLGSVFFAQQL
jgi:hypothetical protein